MSDLIKRLLGACKSHPAEFVSLAPRLLHEAAEHIAELEAALDRACESVETQPKVGRSIDYANGFRVGVQCQRLHAQAARGDFGKRK